MMTYLAYDGKYYKIGKSINPKKRIKQLKTANPKIKLIAYGKSCDESKLHYRYKNKRIGGEWFKFSRRDIEEIIRLLNNEYNESHVDKSKFLKYSKYVIRFGKYNGVRLIDMNSDKELNYIKWFLTKNPRSFTKKAFIWWLKEHGLL